ACLQINTGKICNQACLHCHVEAGPKRTEIIAGTTVDRLIYLMENSPSLKTVDITGGAPEMVPDFRRIVEAAARIGIPEIIDRCNLTILVEPGYEDLASFLKNHQVTIVASLPCYSKENVDKQRGSGTFEASIRGLMLLNDLGYGDPDTDLKLHLVFNPGGASLPPSQEQLEEEYKRRLHEDFGIKFNRLFTITNIPIKRFLRQLKNWGKEDEYMALLAKSFNLQAATQIMCRDLISVGWEGDLFDCDFNQMIELPLGGKRTSIWDIDSLDEIQDSRITFRNHCYGCTAGAGSSCGGALL
ncbi:MAG: arsenosugar biosynthesis radical SAM protein ArsS, partial [Bdellovibrionales bacterium]|nr:arsenosugar biosynthesis radical SAM protein ArsS [Bdellovibrionales bacterium]